MKRIIQSICLGVLMTSLAFAGKYRTFTDNKGRTITARIVDYKSANNKVKIERDNKATALVPLESLSQADQEYVQNWIAGQDFFNPRKLGVTMKKETILPKNVKQPDKSKIVTSACCYKIEIKSAVQINDLTVEYQAPITSMKQRIKIHEDDPNTDKIEKQLDSFIPLRYQKGTTQSITLSKLGRKTLETDEIVACSTTVKLFGYGSPDGKEPFEACTSTTPIFKEEVVGIIVRLSWESPSKEKFERFIYDPPRIEDQYKWKYN